MIVNSERLGVREFRALEGTQCNKPKIPFSAFQKLNSQKIHIQALDPGFPNTVILNPKARPWTFSPKIQVAIQKNNLKTLDFLICQIFSSEF